MKKQEYIERLKRTITILEKNTKDLSDYQKGYRKGVTDILKDIVKDFQNLE